MNEYSICVNIFDESVIYMMKKLLIFIISANVFLFSYANTDDQVGITHEFGFQITGFYSYDEPHFMHTRSKLVDQIKDESKSLQNFGFVYNFKKSILFNQYLGEFELDADYRHTQHDYWSNATGTATNIENHIYNLRTMYGFQLTDKLMLKSGLGWRSLKHPWGGIKTTTGANGYDRIQEYRYVPFLAEIKMPISSIDGELKLEYDHVFYGYNSSEQGHLSGNRDLNFRNDDGYMVKAAYKIPYESIYLEPYYEFHSIEVSNTDTDGNAEPSNTTKEYGIKLTKKFGELTTIPKAKRKNISDDYYFGFGLMETEVESGMSALTGTATQKERDLGKKLFAGINLHENLDLEFAFNRFGQTRLSCNSGDQFVTDGRYNRAANPNDTLLNCGADNRSINIRSNSVAAVIKAKSEDVIINDHAINIFVILGATRWDQSETTKTTGVSTLMNDYNGISKTHGVGASVQKNDLNFSFEYQIYEMYYDAESLGASISYKF